MADPEKTCALLDLPKELRNKIYYLAPEDRSPSAVHVSQAQCTEPSLLGTCRQIADYNSKHLYSREAI